ncbi:FHA domain containing protein [Microcystis aeruginosa PCC 9809]|uniref:FHA domain containing protein n=1 Tax=Microcystis aeruginosa PCC 9809 TaxID=1160285 RepID=I4HV91_MICAE|nr:FHA domain containing protein [Microcystis aeruginosa PCC 9809]
MVSIDFGLGSRRNVLSLLHKLIPVKTLHICLVIGLLTTLLTACGDRLTATNLPTSETLHLPVVQGRISEVAPPALIQELRASLDRYAPQVTILSPLAEQVFDDPQVTVKLQVSGLPIFQDDTLKLGPHLSLIVDNEPAAAIYDLKQPIILENLAPGTHTLRVLALRPWQESFKNDGAFAETTFHILTKTGKNAPDHNLPLLTYSSPQGIYGAEPLLLDFYLSNAPLRLPNTANGDNSLQNWRIRVTVNGESFLLDTWEPIYLKGFAKGNNWVQLEFIDGKGNKIENEFNTSVRVISFDPSYRDGLSQLVRGDLSPTIARSIVDPNYKTIPSLEEKTPIVEPETPIVEEETPVIEPETPVVEEETPGVEETPVIEEETPVIEPESPIVEENPVIEPESPIVEEKPVETETIEKVEETPEAIESPLTTIPETKEINEPASSI